MEILLIALRRKTTDRLFLDVFVVPTTNVVSPDTYIPEESDR